MRLEGMSLVIKGIKVVFLSVGDKLENFLTYAL